ncbi:MAG: hypothetical protein GY705_04340 [Bacteroidetes bacterium]|nr:hypothetical protein [Bacteroidota bacterium]
MKSYILLGIFILIGYSCVSQNILDALKLKEYAIGKYSAGELMPTDTIVDLNNGYYEEYASNGEDNKTILRQASIFRNTDGSTTLGVTASGWDFQCFDYITNFYEISKDTICEVAIYDIIPRLDFKDFIDDTKIISILNSYLPKLQETYLNSNATVEKFLNEIYEITYIMPQRGTSLIATLGICDYIPTNQIHISLEDWSVIEGSSQSIELIYDKNLKIFKKISYKK